MKVVNNEKLVRVSAATWLRLHQLQTKAAEKGAKPTLGEIIERAISKK